MDTETAVKMLDEIQRSINPNYVPTKNPATYLIVELVERHEGALELTTSIVDPFIPDSGDAVAYMALESPQRAMLELTEIINDIAPGVVAVAEQALKDKRLQEHAKSQPAKVFGFLRHLSRRAAAACLGDHASNDTKFDIAIKARVGVEV